MCYSLLDTFESQHIGKYLSADRTYGEYSKYVWEISPLITNWNTEENRFVSSYIEKSLPYIFHFPVWYLEEPNFREIDEENMV